MAPLLHSPRADALSQRLKRVDHRWGRGRGRRHRLWSRNLACNTAVTLAVRHAITTSILFPIRGTALDVLLSLSPDTTATARRPEEGYGRMKSCSSAPLAPQTSKKERRECKANKLRFGCTACDKEARKEVIR
jgi:hypothetical protein